MALPTILFNSGGSDTLASGAGPTTALTGSNASTSGTGLVVTLDGSPDLSGVPTDGSAVLLLIDSTAGARNFSKITAVDNGADTVTVSNAFRTSASGLSWAIGGKRLTISGTTSRKLFENNSGDGDAMPGWILEMESGYTETVTANIRIRRSGDTTDGPITLRGTAGAATTPILTANFNATLFTSGAGNYHQFWDFEVRNTNATKTSSIVFSSGSGGSLLYARRIKCSHATNYFGQFASTNVGGWTIEECDVGYCSVAGAITLTGVSGTIKHCHIHDTTSHAISIGDVHGRAHIEGNLFRVIGGDAINVPATGSSSVGTYIGQNTFYNVTGDCIEFTGTSQGWQALLVENNIASVIGGYGMKWSGASVDKYDLRAVNTIIRNNCLHSCTGGTFSPTNIADIAEGTITSDPSFTNIGSLNFGVGANMKAVGFSPLVLPGTATRSYIDIGAAQREEPAGGGMLVHPGMAGGMRG